MMSNSELLTEGFQLGVETAWKAFEARLTAATKTDLDEMEKEIMAKLSELAGLLKAVKEQTDKAKAEILKKIQALETSLGDVDLPADAETALADLKTSVQSVDDIGDPNA